MSAVGEALTDDDGLYSQMQEGGVWRRPVGRYINAACGSAPFGGWRHHLYGCLAVVSV